MVNGQDVSRSARRKEVERTEEKLCPVASRRALTLQNQVGAVHGFLEFYSTVFHNSHRLLSGVPAHDVLKVSDNISGTVTGLTWSYYFRQVTADCHFCCMHGLQRMFKLQRILVRERILPHVRTPRRHQLKWSALVIICLTFATHFVAPPRSQKGHAAL